MKTRKKGKPSFKHFNIKKIAEDLLNARLEIQRREKRKTITDKAFAEIVGVRISVIAKMFKKELQPDVSLAAQDLEAILVFLSRVLHEDFKIWQGLSDKGYMDFDYEDVGDDLVDVAPEEEIPGFVLADQEGIFIPEEESPTTDEKDVEEFKANNRKKREEKKSNQLELVAEEVFPSSLVVAGVHLLDTGKPVNWAPDALRVLMFAGIRKSIDELPELCDNADLSPLEMAVKDREEKDTKLAALPYTRLINFILHKRLKEPWSGEGQVHSAQYMSSLFRINAVLHLFQETGKSDGFIDFLLKEHEWDPTLRAAAEKGGYLKQ